MGKSHNHLDSHTMSVQSQECSLDNHTTLGQSHKAIHGNSSSCLFKVMEMGTYHILCVAWVAQNVASMGGVAQKEMMMMTFLFVSCTSSLINHLKYPCNQGRVHNEMKLFTFYSHNLIHTLCACWMKLYVILYDICENKRFCILYSVTRKSHDFRFLSQPVPCPMSTRFIFQKLKSNCINANGE